MVGRKVPAALAMRLGQDGARELVDVLDAEQRTWSEQMLTVVTERFERRLIDETARLRVELARDRFEVVKWMFLFWLGQIAAMTAIMSFMLGR
jgi:hypothetical protein